MMPTIVLFMIFAVTLLALTCRGQLFILENEQEQSNIAMLTGILGVLGVAAYFVNAR
jgi:hypothetical protein